MKLTNPLRSSWRASFDAASPALSGGNPVVSITDSRVMKPSITAPTHLRRWKTKFGDALFAQAPIICIGDSITFGQGGNNVNSPNNSPDNVGGWVGQLRSLFAATYGDPGEGFIFPNESRMSSSGSPSSSASSPGVLHNNRVLTSGKSLTITIPTGVTRLGIIQGNATGDVSAKWDIGGVDQGSITTLTNSNNSIITYVTVAATNVVTINGPATAQTTIVGLVLGTSVTTGVPVHRMGQPGYVSGDLLGGQTSGATNVSSASWPVIMKATHIWQSPAGLVICSFGVNDQAGQLGTGAAGGVTIDKYTTWIQTFVDRCIASGWCVLLVGEPPNPNAVTNGVTGGLEADYKAAAATIATNTDHCAYIDIAETWGTATNAFHNSLEMSGSVHPTRNGHGDIARTIHSVLTRPLPFS